jgi:hypothetical protein
MRNAAFPVHCSIGEYLVKKKWIATSETRPTCTTLKKKGTRYNQRETAPIQNKKMFMGHGKGINKRMAPTPFLLDETGDIAAVDEVIPTGTRALPTLEDLHRPREPRERANTGLGVGNEVSCMSSPATSSGSHRSLLSHGQG